MDFRVLAPTSIYDFQAGIRIYLGQLSLANTNTNVFEWTFLCKYEYKCIWIQILGQIQIQIYLGLPKNRQIWIRIWLFGLIFASMITITNNITIKKSICFFFLYNSYKSMQTKAHICHNIQLMVLVFIIWFNIFWQIWIRIYLGWHKRANTNTKIFGLKKKKSK